MKLALITFLAFCLPSQAQLYSVITANLENKTVQRYMSDVKYTSLEEPNLINNYTQNMSRRLDFPDGVMVPIPATDLEPLVLVCAESDDYATGARTFEVGKNAREVTIYNLEPQRTYYFKVCNNDRMLSHGVIHTEGRVRMIYAPTIHNVRDMGGWPTTDGRRIRYGKLYRGAELNGKHVADSVDIDMFTSLLGIGGELDLRATYDTGNGESAFGFAKNTYGISDKPTYYFTSNSGMLPENLTSFNYTYRWRREFEFIVNNLKRGRNVYFHCVWGADRTGYLAMMLEGLLGVDYDGIVKDYELTSLSTIGRAKERIDSAMTYFWGLEGETLKDKFTNYFLETLKVKQTDIDLFKEIMLTEKVIDDDDPTTSIGNHRGDATRPRLYDLNGLPTRGHRRGIAIEIDNNGKAKKIIR